MTFDQSAGLVLTCIQTVAALSGLFLAWKALELALHIYETNTGTPPKRKHSRQKYVLDFWLFSIGATLCVVACLVIAYLRSSNPSSNEAETQQLPLSTTTHTEPLAQLHPANQSEEAPLSSSTATPSATPQPILSTAPPPSVAPPPIVPPSVQTTQNVLLPPPVKPAAITVARPIPSPAHTLPRIKRVVTPVLMNHPRPSPPVYPELTKGTPIVVESTWSDDDSTIAASSLHDALKGDDYTVIDDKSVAPIFIKIEKVDKPQCSEALSCSLSVDVIGQYADGKIFFTQPFTGYEPETSLVENGYDEARDEAVSKAYNFILAITKN